MSKLLFNAGSKMCFCMVAAVLSAPLLFSACSNPQSGGTFTDPRDGKKYRTVRIGNLTWMAQNLNYQTSNSWCYGSNASNCARYGRLYTWNAAMNACPSGWRLPAREDWYKLVEAAGGGNVAGKKLKASSPDWNGTDECGFSALPGGYRSTNGSFSDAGNYGLWWSATEYGSGSAWSRGLFSDYDFVDEDGYGKGNGFSVVCVR